MKTETFIKELDRQIKKSIQSKHDPILRKLYIDSSIKSGKKLRARLLFEFSGGRQKNSVRLAEAIELLHMATLIHDDVLDNSGFRRGRKSLHSKWKVPISILYGDYLFSKSFYSISDLGDPELCKEMGIISHEILQGEIHEQYRRGYVSLGEKEYLRIVRKKSGILFGAACKLGALVKGMGKIDIKRAYEFGINAGMAYQILDDSYDYLNLHKNKDNFNDIKERIITLPMIYLLKKSSGVDKETIRRIITNDGIGSGDIEKLVFFMKKYDILGECVNTIKQYLKKADSLYAYFLPKGFKKHSDVLGQISDRVGFIEKERGVL